MTGLLSPRRPIPRPFYWGSAVLGFVVLLCVWEWAAGYYAGQGKQVLFPSPAAVGQVMQNMVRGATTGRNQPPASFRISPPTCGSAFSASPPPLPWLR